MPANRRRAADTKMAQRAIVNQVLRDDHHERWSLKQLERALGNIEPEAISDAVVRLDANGVVYSLDEFVGASRCARYLDLLNLISI